MIYSKADQNTGELIQGDLIYVSYGKSSNDRLVMGTLYVHSPEEFQHRMRELANRIGISEGEAIKSVWKLGQYPRWKRESPATYAKRLAKLPNPPAIFVTTNEFLH